MEMFSKDPRYVKLESVEGEELDSTEMFETKQFEPDDEDILSQFVAHRKSRITQLIALSVIMTLAVTALPLHRSVDLLFYPRYAPYASLATYVLLGTWMISCLYAPAINRRVNLKVVFILSCVSIICYSASYLYPKSYTLIPTAVLAGLCLGPFFAAQGSLLTVVATSYAKMGNQNVKPMLYLFNGVFHFFFLSAPLWRNIIGVVLQSTQEDVPDLQLANNLTQNSQCGTNFCPTNSMTDIHRKNSTILENSSKFAYVELSVGVQVVCSVFALLISMCTMPKMKAVSTDREGESCSCLGATIQLLTLKKTLLLLPVSIFVGLQQRLFHEMFLRVGDKFNESM